MGFEFWLFDFFVVDLCGYGSIFFKMVDNFCDRIFLNKIVKYVFYIWYGIRVIIVNGEIFIVDYGFCIFSISVLVSDFVIFLFKFF